MGECLGLGPLIPRGNEPGACRRCPWRARRRAPPSAPPCAQDVLIRLAARARARAMQTVPDINTANAFLAASFSEYQVCLTTYGVSTAVDKATDVFGLAASATQSLPAQALSAVTLLLGLALCFYGYALVRPANLAIGAYLGGTVALMLLNIFAPTLSSCVVTVAFASAAGLITGLLCAAKRPSVMAMLGLVIGEIVGDLFYKTFLAAVAPEYVAFGCIGFFSVLLAVLAANLGDFAWKVGCAFFGAYLALSHLLKLVVVPYVPNGAQFLAFLAYKPDVARFLAAEGAADRQALIGSPYVYGPVLALALLTAAGTATQVALLRASTKGVEMR